MRHLRVLAVLLALALPALAATPTGVPMVVPSQGRLLDGADQPVNGPAKLTFSLYPVGDDLPGRPATAAVWTSSYNVVLDHGVYAVSLGDTANGGTALTSDKFDPAEERWLGVKVNDGQELRPRLRVGAHPFAAVSAQALDAVKLGGQLPATYHDAALLTGQVPAAALDNALQAIAVSGALTAEKVGPQVTLGLATADAATTGALTSADWARFDTGASTAATAKTTADQAKATAGTAVQAITATAPVAVLRTGNGVSVGLSQATPTTDGYITSNDYVAFSTGPIADTRLSNKVVLQGGAASFSGLTVTGAGGLTIPDGSVDAAKLGKSACAPGQILKRNAGDTAWVCADLPAQPWTRVSFDDFEAGVGAWTGSARTTCGAVGNILGGYGVAGTGATATKVITGLPAHKSVRIVAKYHFIDSWDFERGWAKVDGAEVWTRTSMAAFNGENTCGNGSTDRLNVPVEVTVQHTAGSLTLQFGSTLNQDAGDESWGIDDVAVYVSDSEPGWRLVARDTFDTGTAAGWSNNTVTAMAGAYVLGGYNVFGPGAVSKVYDLAGIPHSEVRVRAEYLPIDSWDGEAAYMGIDGQTDTAQDGVGTRAWSGTGRCTSKPNLWGNAAYGDCDSIQVDGTGATGLRYARVTFGSALDEVGTNESWGLRFVEVWAR